MGKKMSHLNKLLDRKKGPRKTHPLTRYRGTNPQVTTKNLNLAPCTTTDTDPSEEELSEIEISERDFDEIISSSVNKNSNEIAALKAQIESAMRLYNQKEIAKGKYDDKKKLKYFSQGSSITYRVVDNGECGFRIGED